MKTVCFFSGDITRSGGTERVATIIMNHLQELQEYNVLAVSLTEQQNETFFELNRQIKRFSLGPQWINPGPGYIKFIPKLRKILKSESVDIIIDIDIVLDIISVPASKKLKTKIVSWEHFSYSFESSVFYRNFIIHHILPKTDCLVTLTEGDAAAYKKNLPDLRKVLSIYNPIISINNMAAHDKNQVVWAGRLAEEKGVDYLETVSKAVLKEHKNWIWYVLGDGKLRDELESFVCDNHLEDQLILQGRVNNVQEYLENSKLYVMTSHREGLPMSLLEAKSVGLACVSFDCPMGPREIIENDVDGFLIPCFDTDQMINAINTLIKDSEMLTRFGKNALKNTDKFGLGHIINTWDCLLKSIME